MIQLPDVDKSVWGWYKETDDILYIKEQDKSSDIEKQPPFGDRKLNNTQPQNKEVWGLKTNGNII